MEGGRAGARARAKESNGESDGEGSIAQLLAEEEQTNEWQSYFAN